MQRLMTQKRSGQAFYISDWQRWPPLSVKSTCAHGDITCATRCISLLLFFFVIFVIFNPSFLKTKRLYEDNMWTVLQEVLVMVLPAALCSSDVHQRVRRSVVNQRGPQVPITPQRAERKR